MYIAMALSAGALVIVSISINGNLATRVGLIQSGLTNYVVGLISSIIFYLVLYGTFGGLTIEKLGSAPYYFYLGGAVGSFIIILNNILINRISAVYVTVLVFLGQMVAGILIDYYKTQIFSVGKLIGGFIIVVGLVCYILGDKKAEEIEAIK